MYAMRLNVDGMTCSHCERAVEQALAAMPGVVRVTADRGASEVVMEGEGPWDRAVIEEVLDEEGYALRP